MLNCSWEQGSVSMKVRNGFVSNSSSSSFVVVGKRYDWDEYLAQAGVTIDKEEYYEGVTESGRDEYLSDIIKDVHPDIKYSINEYGTIGECEAIICYYDVPNNPDDAIKVIKAAQKEFGKDTFVMVIENDWGESFYEANR